MTDAHQLLARLVVAATIALLFACLWSTISARRSAGRLDHRFAVDRLLLLVVALVAVTGIAGLFLVAADSRPADVLHLLYGPAALITLPIGVWLSRRGRDVGRGAAPRRDGWLAAAAIILLGIELRLFMTG